MSSSTSGSGGSSYNPASVAITGGTITGTSVAGYLPLAGGTLTGTLLFSVDNTYNIGAAGATRPAHVYVGTDLTSSSVYGGSAAGSTLTLDGTSNGSPSNAYVLLNPAGQGNVGIGTTNPSQMLQVGNNPSSAVGMRIAGSAVNWDLLSDSSGNFVINNGNGTMFQIAQSNSAVTMNGNVGIGTTVPGSLLTVKGGDAFVDGTATGVILRDRVVTTNCYRITIASGLVTPTLTTCPTD
jgi:hypothetical protein